MFTLCVCVHLWLLGLILQQHDNKSIDLSVAVAVLLSECFCFKNSCQLDRVDADKLEVCLSAAGVLADISTNMYIHIFTFTHMYKLGSLDWSWLAWCQMHVLFGTEERLS